MSSRVLVVAPHPDDEILGCGGTLLRRKAAGAELGWLIVTGISEAGGWAPARVAQREVEIGQVAQAVGFSHVFNLRLAPARLDSVPMWDMVEHFSSVFTSFEPDEVFVPHRSDVHTDHRVVFDAAIACTKWFRYPFVRRVLAYETVSETEYGLDPDAAFAPTCFVDIGEFVERKLELMSIYQSELGAFPFPRSLEAIRALATFRGATSGFLAAEAFQLLRERQ